MSPLQRSDFEALLTLQEVDIELSRLRERRRALEGDSGAELAAAEAAAALELEEARAAVDEARRHQIRKEGALTDLEERIRQAEARLRRLSDAGQIEAAQRELDQARKLGSSTEDELLEAMQRVEDGESAVAEAERRVEEAHGRRREAEGDRAGELREIEAAMTDAEARLADSRGSVPDELVAEYDQRRSAGKRVVVARFESGRCGSCHLTLPATEADRIRTAPDDAIVTCDDCGTILVRRPRGPRADPLDEG